MNQRYRAAVGICGVVCISQLIAACSADFTSCAANKTCAAGGYGNGGSPASQSGAAGQGGSVGGRVETFAGAAGKDVPEGEAGGTSEAGAGGEAGETNEAGAGGVAGVPPSSCGNGKLDSGEDCDLGSANNSKAYGPGLCTDRCKTAPYCGDGTRNGTEVCDEGGSGSTALGACDPECSGYYEKKFIKPTFTAAPLSTNLGGISGADATCVSQYGPGWKALIVGKTRRATVTPLLGDQQLDWVLQKYRYYYNQTSELVWRTDEVALLGVRGGKRYEIYANLFPFTGTYPWAGFRLDWTTFDDNPSTSQGTCNSWTTDTGGFGNFVTPDLTVVASEACGSTAFILCVGQ
ncbi:MAG TPA: DUF1554 domain-containing protein [Polyangiaceae bacterium]|nr:DUF1554 domain-containing protein [Polyangiaceae bacterium]